MSNIEAEIIAREAVKRHETMYHSPQSDERRNVYADTEQRMRHDAEFRAVVEMLTGFALQHGYTPGELRQVAFAAAIRAEMQTNRSITVEVAGSRTAVVGPPGAPSVMWFCTKHDGCGVGPGCPLCEEEAKP